MLVQATVYVVMEKCPLAEAFQVLCDASTVIPCPSDTSRFIPNGSYSSYAATKGPTTAGVELFDYIGKLSDLQCRYVVRQLLALLAYLHQVLEDGSRIVHRDIKIENTLVWAWHEEKGEKFPVIKVIDFGLARVIPEGTSSILTFHP
jgi:serine/threonine protein kinase